jgi:hypothetical protein
VDVVVDAVMGLPTDPAQLVRLDRDVNVGKSFNLNGQSVTMKVGTVSLEANVTPGTAGQFIVDGSTFNLAASGQATIFAKAGAVNFNAAQDLQALHLEGAAVTANADVSALVLDGNGTIGGAGRVVVPAGGVISPGASVGNITINGGLDMTAVTPDVAAPTFVWELGALDDVNPSNWDALTLTGGDLVLGGESILSLNFGLLAEAQRPGAASPDSFWSTERTWKVIDVIDPATNSGNTNFASVANNVTVGDNSFLTYVGDGTTGDLGDVYLKFGVGGAVIPAWSGAVDSDWAKAGNWTTGVVVAAGGQAYFPQGTTTQTVDLGGGTQSAGIVRFAGNDDYTVQNGTLAINNNGSAGLIATESGGDGEHTISAAVSIVDDASITVAGGKLNLSGGVTIASGKTLSVTQAAAEALSISALNGGTGTLSLGDATVTKVTGDSSIAQLALAGSAQLDLSTADLTVTGGDLATINGLVATGRAGGDWDGIGINSSALAADSAHKTLAVLPEGAGVKVKYTWAGDLTGDEVINGADYFVLDYGFLTGGASALYADGNVNYTAGIDGDDYFVMDQAFLNQSAVLSAGSAGGVEVPEPSTLGVLAIGALGLLARRRRSLKA